MSDLPAAMISLLNPRRAPGSQLSRRSALGALFASAAVQADRITVYKSRRELLLLRAGAVLRRYQVALGGNPIGPKEREGDQRTPEGLYRIDGRYLQSQFHRALHISYPNPQDRARARRLGVSPGGSILIHGLPNGQGSIGKAHLRTDWTLGCIAVTDEEIEEIWRLVPDGTVIEILP